MIWAERSASDRGPANGVESRRDARHATDVVRCALGDIVDLSASGMRLACEGKPPIRKDSTASIALEFGNQQIHLVAQARWVRRKGLLWGSFGGQYEIGLRFLQLTPRKRASLASLAEFGFISDSAGSGSSRRSTGPAGAEMRATFDLPDYYGLLELSPDAEPGDVKTAFRRLARRYHPDTTTDPDGEAKFRAVKEAYAILNDVQRRQSYDRMRTRS